MRIIENPISETSHSKPARPQPSGRLSNGANQIWFRLKLLDRRRAMALGLAVLAAFITQSALSRASRIEAGLGTRVPTVVAANNLAAGQVLTSDSLVIEMWPLDLVPPGAARNPADLVDQTVRSAIAAGEPVTQSRASAGSLGLTPAEVGVTLPMPLAAPPVGIGQIVQLVGVRSPTANTFTTASLITDGRIVSFSEDAVTVAVPATKAQLLIEYSALGVVEVVITPQRG